MTGPMFWLSLAWLYWPELAQDLNLFLFYLSYRDITAYLAKFGEAWPKQRQNKINIQLYSTKYTWLGHSKIKSNPDKTIQPPIKTSALQCLILFLAGR